MRACRVAARRAGTPLLMAVALGATALIAPMGGFAQADGGGGEPTARICIVGPPADATTTAGDEMTRGLERAERRFGVEGVIVTPERGDDVFAELEAFAQSGSCDLIIGDLLGGLVMSELAVAYPEQRFVSLDWVPDQLDNLRSVLFAADEAAFLAGYAAAALTHTGTVGVFGGVQIDGVTAFMDGFALGVAHHNDVKGTSVEVLGWDPSRAEGLFAGNFDDVELGRELTHELFDQGADIVLPVAGPLQFGAAEAAQERHAAGDDVHVIGVDDDLFRLVDRTTGRRVLTSVVKNYHKAVFHQIKDLVRSRWEPGVDTENLKSRGVGLAPWHKARRDVPKELRWELRQVRRLIVTGEVDTRPVAGYVVRTGYVIPSDRTLDPDKVVDLQRYLTRIQWLYGENMARHGFGHRTFTFETEADGLTPKINIVDDDHDAAHFLAEDVGYHRATQWERLLTAMADGGFPGIATVEGETWILIGEMHVQFPDGSTIAGPFVGGSGGRDHGGQTFLGGGLLFRVNEPFLTDLRPYDGLTFPQFGPYPLVFPISFPGGGPTVSSIAATAQYVIAHELGHAFGNLPHQPRNRRNLMGACREGFRGVFFPELFPTEDCNLAYGSALALRHNRFFDATRTFDDDTDPDLTVDTAPGSVEPVEGHLEITFSASDPSGLVAAFLWRLPVDEWEALELPGTTSGTWSFRTPYYEPGVATEYAVLVMDAQGNTARRIVELTVEPGFNRAPTPLVRLADGAPGNSLIRAGSTVTLSAVEDWEFRHNADWPATTVEWDPDGDGTFDTAPTTDKQHSWSYPDPGVYSVIARFTDPDGAVTVSSPIGIRVFE